MKQWLKPQTIISLILAVSALLTAIGQYLEKREIAHQLHKSEALNEKQEAVIESILE